VIANLPFVGTTLVCSGEVGYAAVRADVCKRMDILRKNGGAAVAPCDAMSFLFAFDGVQAIQGVPEVVPQIDAGACPPGMKFDCQDVDF